MVVVVGGDGCGVEGKRRRGWMSCLADSNLTAIREGRAADLLAGGRRCWRTRADVWRWDGLGLGGGDVIYATLHTSTSRLCTSGFRVCVRAHAPTSQTCLLITSFHSIQLSLRLNCPALIFCSPTRLPLSSFNHPPLPPPPVPLYISSVSCRVTRLALNLTVSRGSIFILSLFS